MDMERVGPKEAAAELHMDVVSLHHLMRQQRLPIGVAIKKEGKTRWSYYIYRNLLDKYKQTGGERVAPDKYNGGTTGNSGAVQYSIPYASR